MIIILVLNINHSFGKRIMRSCSNNLKKNNFQELKLQRKKKKKKHSNKPNEKK